MRQILFIALALLSTPAWAGGGSYLSQGVNTILLILLLVYVGKTPILNSFSKRSKDIAIDIDEAQKTLNDAKSYDESVQKKLDSLEDQINAIKEEAHQESIAIKNDLQNQAEQEILRIKKSPKG